MALPNLRSTFLALLTLTGAFLALPSFTAAQTIDDQAQSNSEPVDEAKRDAILRLFEVIKVEEQMQQMMDPMLQQILSLMLKSNPGEENTIMPIVNEELSKSFRNIIPDLMNLTAGVYYRHFDTTDIEGLIDFFESPVGQKFLEKQTVVFQESFTGGMAIGQQAAREALPRITERMRALNLETPKGL